MANTIYALYLFEFPNGKVYIGISSHVKNRWIEHSKLSAKSYVSNAIKKYGFDNVKKTILCYGSMEYICDLEIKAIEKWNSRNKNFGYNIAIGGQTSPSKCKETANKISKSKIGHSVSIETRDKIRASVSLHFENQENRNKQREKTLKNWGNEDYRRKNIEAKKASITEDWLKANSERGKKQYETKEQKQKMRERVQAYWDNDPNARDFQSNLKKSLWADPEWRAKTIAAQNEGKRIKNGK